ncbi:hypothetical protein BGW39_008021 [Mortierella sp. 14UC]|nr:hypothetical protein BGW39_008021 [Mortierella sp. 14UC]
MSESPLPLECLQAVISILSNNDDIHFLSTLLRVNRFFAEATLPILYADPFGEQFNALQGWTTGRSLLLIRTLLRQVSAEDLTPLLKTFFFGDQAFGGDKDPLPAEDLGQPYTAVLHYLPHVRNLFPDPLPLCFHLPSCQLAQYLRTVGLHDQYAAEDLYGGINPEHSNYFVAHAFREDVKRQLVWALCVPENVHTLSIALSDCGRFLERVGRFDRLSSVRFLFDKQHEYGSDWVEQMSPEAQAQELGFRDERSRYLETMVELV